MNIKQLFEAVEKLKRSQMGMGLEKMVNADIALVGGMRSGSSPAGKTRLKYMLYDVPMFNEGGDQAAEIGFIELFIMDGTGDIDGIVNIEIKPKFRRGGYGKKIIESLLKTTNNDLKVFDIQRKAVTFWKKLGTEFYSDANFKNPLKATTKTKQFMYGIIRK